MKWLIIGLTSFLLIFATNGFAIASSKGKLNASVLVTPPRQNVKISHIPLIVSDALVDINSAVINSPQKQHFRRLSSLSPSRSVKSKSSSRSAIDLDAEFPGGVLREIQSDHLSLNRSVKSKSSTRSAIDLDAEFPNNGAKEVPSYNDYASLTSKISQSKTSISSYNSDQMVLRNDKPIVILQRRLQDGLIKFAMEKGIYDKESKPFEKAQLSVEERQQILQRLDKIHSDFLTAQSSSRQMKQSADTILRTIKESFIDRLHVKDLELERRLKNKLTTLARDKGFDSFDGISLPLIDTNGKLSNSRTVILNALDQVFFDFLEEKEDNYTSKNKRDAAILLAHIKNVDFLNLLQPTPDTSNIDELMGQDLIGAVTEAESINKEPVSSIALSLKPVSSGKNLGLSSDVETLPDVVAEVSEPLTKETELLINDILDSEGSNQIKKDLIKELIAHHEKIKLKKAKGQEVILAVKQNPEKTAELLSEVDFDFDESLQDPNNTNESSSTSSMNKAARYLSAMQNLESGEIEQEISHFKQRANLITPEISNILFSSVFTQIENRMLMVGVAAGEEVKKINKSVWISGFYGSAKQGSSSNIDAYRFNTGGVTIGADINLGENEANLIGLAYGKARSKFKMTQTRGDKFNVNHDIFSIYGQSEITNRLLLQGAVSYVKGKVTNKSVKLVGADRYETATGKFNTKGYNIRSQLSYKFNLDKFVLTPSIGFKYGKITEGAYDETGNDVFNLSVISKSRKILSGIAGIKASMPQVIAENINFEPSLNSSVEKILQDKVKQGKVKLQWADREFENDTNTSKLPKLAYNIGGSVLVKRNNTEIEASYNCHLKKKYVGHQGTLKLKLLF